MLKMWSLAPSIPFRDRDSFFCMESGFLFLYVTGSTNKCKVGGLFAQPLLMVWLALPRMLMGQ